MADINKYDVFLNELASLEEHVSVMMDTLKRAEERRFELEKQMQTLKKENEYYKVQLENIANDADFKKFPDAQTDKEREQFRKRIFDLIQKIDSQIAQM